jgi:uncharacterized protein YwgA
MATIGRRELLLLLVGLDDPTERGLGGITRIQKLLFLLDAEENIKPGAEGFKFVAYKAGPYSPKIYDDLEFLENFGFLKRSGYSEATEAEKSEVDLTFEELMGPEDVIGASEEDVAPTPDTYEEARYHITPEGKKKVEELLRQQQYQPFIEGIRKVKSRFAKYSLNDLLYYVYTRHPEMTTESEIKEKVLRRRPMRH